MSNKASFGRDVSEFLRARGLSEGQSDLSAYGIRITSLIACGGDRVTVRISVSNPSGGEVREFVIMKSHAEQLNLAIGDLEEEMIGEIEYYAEVARAYGSACSSFAFAPSSYSALFKKLLAKGFDRDISADAIDCMRESGFVKEDEIALRRAQIFVEKHWGRRKILSKLHEEGFGDGALNLAREYLDETDFGEICAAHIRKKYGQIPEEDHAKDLMYASLSRMGFTISDIREALKLM